MKCENRLLLLNNSGKHCGVTWDLSVDKEAKVVLLLRGKVFSMFLVNNVELNGLFCDNYRENL